MASNNKTFYVEKTGFSMRLARVAQNSEGGVIEEIREASPGSVEEARDFVQGFSKLPNAALVRAVCSVYPESRLLRNCSLKDSGQNGDIATLDEVVATQFRVNPGEYGLQALHADDGLEMKPSRIQRELFVCGAPKTELREAQSYLVEAGVYPLRMELGSVATIGLLLNSMRIQNIQEPALVLEIGEESSHVIILGKDRVESARPLPLGLNTMIAGVRQELGLKDEGAARKLFFSDSFDFREMGPRLIDRLLREVQSMIGFYEVQTGQSITKMTATLLPAKLAWLTGTFASSLGMSRLKLDLPAVLAESKITVGEGTSAMNLEALLGLVGLMIKTEIAQ